ncbi:MAG: hypothetical protein A3F24_00415 [Candidatus Colwellbacteria bacterium RIFCSPHIGHO2_12_FULL_44_17]|uniref:M23ase beta-sheet core domain-containing protein n=1 Tax=Candidatus Colwellbacteria bacterium RIFCSPHIGHO2_12_FULL_44_17 TaxID=1797689 RepID=A0A1G1Z4V7_9BACT|nr:MAG: hypothetical protein A3F24_00415 [Candidatus Colwellbacteria bacterium RIFCSPHIGHO2_12_FULL_44_17]
MSKKKKISLRIIFVLSSSITLVFAAERFTMPITGSGWCITQGYETDYTHKAGTNDRYAVDLNCKPKKTPIIAAGDGTVIEARRDVVDYGTHVKIQHNNGIVSLYGHLIDFGPGIKKGAKVNKGDLIGYLGSTGNSTGPHLHFSMLENGVPRRLDDLAGFSSLGYQPSSVDFNPDSGVPPFTGNVENPITPDDIINNFKYQGSSLVDLKVNGQNGMIKLKSPASYTISWSINPQLRNASCVLNDTEFQYNQVIETPTGAIEITNMTTKASGTEYPWRTFYYTISCQFLDKVGEAHTDAVGVLVEK